MPHPKLVSLIVMLTVFASVGGTSWALMNSHANSEVTSQELARDAVMAYIKNSHPETGQFMENLFWTGGQTTPGGIVGSETYFYESKSGMFIYSWALEMKYPVVLNPIYTISANFTGRGVTNAIAWQGTWQTGIITETSYYFEPY